MPSMDTLDLPKYLHRCPSDYELFIEYGWLSLPIVKKILYRTYLRTVLSERQGHRCCYCGRGMNDTHNSSIQCTLEHVIPESRGGATDLWNCVVACAKCNRTRGNVYTALEDEVLLGYTNEHRFVRPYGADVESPLDSPKPTI